MTDPRTGQNPVRRSYFEGKTKMDLSNLDAGSITAIAVCGLIIVVAIVRFIIYLISNKKDK